MNEVFENIDWVDAKETRRVPTALKPKIDEVISKAIGKTVYMQDPRLIRLICKWKRGKSRDSMIPDNYLENPEFIKELKETFNAPL